MSLGEGVAVAILAGGLGSRLRTVVADRPKVLASVADRPFLAHLLDQLAAVSVRSVCLLVGHGACQVQQALGDHHGDVALHYSNEPTPLGTGGAICWALPKLDAPAILLFNGDSYCECDLSGFLAFHRRQQAQASLVLSWSGDCSRYGQVVLDELGQARSFQEKGNITSGWINAGIYLLSRRLLEDVTAGRQVSLERDLLPRWVRSPGVRGYCCAGRFLDIGTPQSYASAERFFAPAEPMECHAGRC